MPDLTKDVQGVAVYAEFARPSATTQVIIVPDGYDNEGRLIGLSVVRRVITASTPKKPWKFSILEPTNPASVITDADSDTICAQRMAIPATLFDQILSGGWTMVGQPILIEASKKDMDDIGTKKTPTKMLYRINQSRTALGFPAALINS